MYSIVISDYKEDLYSIHKHPIGNNSLITCGLSKTQANAIVEELNKNSEIINNSENFDILHQVLVSNYSILTKL